MFLQPASAAAAKPLPVSPDCFLSLQLVPSRRPRPKPNATVPVLRLKDKIDDFGGFRQSFGSWNVGACMLANDKNKVNLNIELLDVTKRSAWSFSVPRKVSRQVQQEAEKRCENELPGAQKETPTGRTEKKQFVDLMQVTPSFSTGILDDPFVNKLRSRLGSWHGTTMSFPPVTRTVVALFGFFFFLVGVVFDKLWTSRKVKKQSTEPRTGIRPQVPTSLSRFLEEDLQRKESVEWVNMVLGKLWKVYRLGLEDWLVGLLQPLIDNLNKPDYVQRVEIKQFCLGEEPISVRSVERRTSRRANDLQYQIGLRYTGGARMLLMLSLKFGIVPIMIPVGVRDLDVDGELWVKLRLVPSEPWVGTVTWAFVSLPKIKLDLAPFRIFNLMAIPVLSMFLTKLLTEDLPRLFVRPNEIVLNFQKGRATGPVSKDFKNGIVQEGNRDFVGELSVTLVDARKLNYVPYGKTDPYVVLVLGDQVIRSKKNSQTTVIGPPGAPIWNQDFQLLVVNPQKQRLSVEVRDSFGLTTFTIGVGEVELGTLQDTVPTDRIVTLQGGWGLFKKRFSGEILLRLTYKAYVEDEEDDKTRDKPLDDVVSDEEMSESEEKAQSDTSISKGVSTASEKESFMDKFVALLVSEEFQGIFASEAGSIKNAEEVTASQSFAANPKDGNKTIQFMDNENSTAQFVDSANSTTQIMDNEKEKDQEGFVIFWLGLVTGIAVLVAISLNGSNFFNP